MPSPTTDEQTNAAPHGTHTFRASTIEEAVAAAERALGCRVSLVSANRIRRGGLGGFFAADLGVEVVVSPIQETVESALERLIATSTSDERSRWEAGQAGERDAAVLQVGDSDSAAAVAAALAAVVGGQAMVDSPGRSWLRRRTAAVEETAVTGDSWYSPPTSEFDRGNHPDRLARLAELDRVFRVLPGDSPSGTTDDRSGRPVGAASPSRVDPSVGSPGLARVERIIEELQALSVTPPNWPRVSRDTAGTLPPREHHRSAPPRETHMEVSAEPPVEAAVEGVHGAGPAALATPRSIAVLPAGDRPTPRSATVPTATATVPAATAAVSVADEPLTQRQVELAVSAADALLGSLRREDGVKRLSVRVVLRTGDHDEVAAEAEWDASE